LYLREYRINYKGLEKMKKIIILDVEGNSTVRPYNIGYLIATTKGEIIDKKSFAFTACIFENLQNCLHAEEMTHKNIEEILKDENEQKYNKISIEDFKKIFINDLIVNDIKEIWAYNCNFDKRALQRLLLEDYSLIEHKAAFYDIWSAIVYTRLINKKYIKFCRKNNFISQAGNCMTNAQTVYNYLKNSVDFVEEHTALNDCLIEYEIYLAAKRTKKKMVQKGAPWNAIKQFCETNNL
jgi:hypothetical protein